MTFRFKSGRMYQDFHMSHIESKRKFVVNENEPQRAGAINLSYLLPQWYLREFQATPPKENKHKP